VNKPEGKKTTWKSLAWMDMRIMMGFEGDGM
jgi:hypothetical protein